MKNPPTLADALVGWSLGKHLHPGAVQHCRQVVNARKFVLDQPTVLYLAELETAALGQGHRKHHRMLDMLRAQARLPHSLTWIEFDPRPYRDYTINQYGMRLKPDRQTVARRGYLLQQHPRIDTAFRCVEYNAEDNLEHLTANFWAVAWCTDSMPVPWPLQQQIPEHWRTTEQQDATASAIADSTGGPHSDLWTDSEILVGSTGYRTQQLRLVDAIDDPPWRELLRLRLTPKEMWKMKVTARLLWLLLALINDLPVRIEEVTPSKGYVARGSYKRFLEHSIVHLNVPETVRRRVIAESILLIRRRAHQVRGHWRRDRLHPLLPGCTHVFDDDMVCQHCNGHKIWIAEHQRGDASLGFVTHDYAVHHRE